MVTRYGTTEFHSAWESMDLGRVGRLDEKRKQFGS
jgi:hypothetical protein